MGILPLCSIKPESEASGKSRRPSIDRFRANNYRSGHSPEMEIPVRKARRQIELFLQFMHIYLLQF